MIIMDLNDYFYDVSIERRFDKVLFHGIPLRFIYTHKKKLGNVCGSY